MTNFRADNARDKSLAEIVASYVKPPEVDQIKDWWGNVILGPRGTGKTTILKVLSTGGVRAFGDRGMVVPHEVSFVGAYVPADDHWSRATADLSVPEQEYLYRLLVCRSCVLALQDLVHSPELFGSPTWDTVTQHGVALDVAEALGLSGRYSSLLSIADRVDREIEDAARSVSRDADSPSLRRATSGLGLTGMAELVLRPAQRRATALDRWALLLDELELAPDAIYTAVWRELRNPGGFVRLKVALLAGGEFRSPGLSEAEMPQPGHDYTPFRLGADRQSYVKFATDLGARLLDTHLGAAGRSTSLGRILGDDVVGRPRGSLGAGTAHERRAHDMSELATRDRGFEEWFASKPQVDDRLARKIATMVRFRYDYSRTAASGPRRRTLELYCGFPALFRTTEGNPRRVTWLMNELLGHLQSANRVSVPINDQAKILNKVVARQVDVLGAMRPGSAPTAPSVLELVDALGEFFRVASIESAFREDPVSTFVLRPSDPAVLHDLVELGLQWGGLVETRRSGSAADAEAVRRYLRLDALMAVRHRLPLKVGKPRRIDSMDAVNRILDSRVGLRAVRTDSPQLTLWEPVG